MVAEWGEEIIASYPEPALFDTGVPHCSRVYEY